MNPAFGSHMPRYPRYVLLHDHCTFHITWQCHNKEFLLKSPWAKKTYYDLLLRFKNRYEVSIYSYCFMSSHPHITGYCKDRNLLSDFFRIVNSLFAKAYNKKHNRRGQVVMDRFKSPRIKTDVDLLKVMHYVDLNPKRAHIVAHPKDYRWSSYGYYAYGNPDVLITPAPSYLNLSPHPKERQKNYQKMVGEILKNDWKEKKPYSSVPFIGDPDWVYQKTLHLKEFQRKRRKAWLERFQKKFENKLPPKITGK